MQSTNAAETAPEGFAVVGVSTSGLLSILTNGIFLSTGFPALIGATLHAVKKAKDNDLTLVDAFIAFIVALAIGFWGGPYIAELAPNTEKALPILSFASAYFASDVLVFAKTHIETLSKKGD